MACGQSTLLPPNTRMKMYYLPKDQHLWSFQYLMQSNPYGHNKLFLRKNIGYPFNLLMLIFVCVIHTPNEQINTNTTAMGAFLDYTVNYE